MENEIKVGSVVFHKRPIVNEFQGPGAVLAIEYNGEMGLDMVTVLWPNAGSVVHTRTSLITLAEKAEQNVG